MSGKAAGKEINLHVSKRVRAARNAAGLSQEAVANRLGVTFQQVQKYEKGTNRIGASRLQQISRTLGVPVAFFFEGAPNLEETEGFGEGASPPYVAEFLSTAEGLSLTRAFTKIRDARVRRRIVELVEALAEQPV